MIIVELTIQKLTFSKSTYIEINVEEPTILYNLRYNELIVLKILKVYEMRRNQCFRYYTISKTSISSHSLLLVLIY